MNDLGRSKLNLLIERIKEFSIYERDSLASCILGINLGPNNNKNIGIYVEVNLLHNVML
jgi:hypothetical protein